jgi:hypothetical protein
LPRIERSRPAIAWCTSTAASDRSFTLIGRMAAGRTRAGAQPDCLPIPGDTARCSIHGGAQTWPSAIQHALEQGDRY